MGRGRKEEVGTSLCPVVRSVLSLPRAQVQSLVGVQSIHTTVWCGQKKVEGVSQEMEKDQPSAQPCHRDPRPSSLATGAAWSRGDSA